MDRFQICSSLQNTFTFCTLTAVPVTKACIAFKIIMECSRDRPKMWKNLKKYFFGSGLLTFCTAYEFEKKR